MKPPVDTTPIFANARMREAHILVSHIFRNWIEAGIGHASQPLLAEMQ
jgi:hypothetical protein